jgi:hypothetical protein
MGCLGVHFAITPEEARQIQAQRNDKSLLEVVHEIEERWDEEWLQDTDKAWDAIHRSLTGGSLGWGDTPFHKVILGKDSLHKSDSYIVNHLTPQEVTEVADAIRGIKRDEFRQGHDQIDPTDYGFPVDDEHFEYVWNWFEELQAFFNKVAGSGRWVMFTASQ